MVTKLIKRLFMLSLILNLIFLSSAPAQAGLFKHSSKPNKKNENISPPVTAPVPKIKVESNKPKIWQPELKVGIMKTDNQIKLKSNVSSVIVDSKNDSLIKSLKKDTEFILTVAGGHIQIDGQVINNTEIELKSRPDVFLRDMKISINNKNYCGRVKIILRGNALTVINIVPTEEYLRSVLPKEMPPSWNEEALKAQAVAARTFALKNRKRHESEGYDLCTTTHCQIYDDLSMATDFTDKAISDTFGEVLVYKDKLIDATFHTDSGGMTENVVDVWGTDVPYLRAATEINTKTQAWTMNFSVADFSKKLAETQHNVGTVQFVKLSTLEIGKLTNDRSTSGRVKELTIFGSDGEVKLTGETMRSIFGLKSTLFDVRINDNEVVFNGYGWGHGIGMSQHGAQAFAEHGYNYDKILLHYYKGTNLKHLY